MTKDQVIELRDTLNANSDGIVITMDNMKVFSDTSDIIVWDDSTEQIHAIRANDDYNSQKECPVEVISSTYEHIQYITGYMDSLKLKSLLDGYFSGLMDNDAKAKAEAFLTSVNGNLEDFIK